jgi:transcriptional regulator NrdR family protein
MARKAARRTARKSARKPARRTARRTVKRRTARKPARRTVRRRAARPARRRVARPASRVAEAGITFGRAIQVVKRDGSREDFDREKIRRGIMRAAERANVSEGRAMELADRIASMIERDARDSLTTIEIRDRLLAELDREERAIADAFRAFRETGF